MLIYCTYASRGAPPEGPSARPIAGVLFLVWMSQILVVNCFDAFKVLLCEARDMKRYQHY